MADGLRINWRFVEARFVGPVLEGAFLPGAADCMRIRPDGVGMVQVIGCIRDAHRSAHIHVLRWRRGPWSRRLRAGSARRV